MNKVDTSCISENDCEEEEKKFDAELGFPAPEDDEEAGEKSDDEDAEKADDEDAEKAEPEPAENAIRRKRRFRMNS